MLSPSGTKLQNVHGKSSSYQPHQQQTHDEQQHESSNRQHGGASIMPPPAYPTHNDVARNQGDASIAPSASKILDNVNPIADGSDDVRATASSSDAEKAWKHSDNEHPSISAETIKKNGLHCCFTHCLPGCCLLVGVALLVAGVIIFAVVSSSVDNPEEGPEAFARWHPAQCIATVTHVQEIRACCVQEGTSESVETSVVSQNAATANLPAGIPPAPDANETLPCNTTGASAPRRGLNSKFASPWELQVRSQARRLDNCATTRECLGNMTAAKLHI